MKKTLLFVAMSALILNATGCGICRNGLFARHRATVAPMVGHVQQCAPVCQPCCPPPCDPCCTGTSVTAGYDGGVMMVPNMDAGCACGP